MIEHLILKRLGEDATLTAMLASTTAIYAIEAPQRQKTPYIVANTSYIGLDEILDEDRLEIKVVADTVPHLTAIRDRLKYLLDIDNDIRTEVSDNQYRVYYGKLTGTAGQYRDPETNDAIDVMFFNFKYLDLTKYP
jgi:hypothetical protein